MEKYAYASGSLIGTDFSRIERQASLRKMQRPSTFASFKARPAIARVAVIAQDVCANDRRSINAQLAGRGALRAAWWNLHVQARLCFNKNAVLEDTMFAFHSRHHKITLGFHRLASEVRAVYGALDKKGNLAAFWVICDIERQNANHR